MFLLSSLFQDIMWLPVVCHKIGTLWPSSLGPWAACWFCPPFSKFHRPHFFITSPDGWAILRKYICHLLKVPFCLFNIHSWCHLFYLKCLPIPTIPLPYLLLPDFSTQQYLTLRYSHLMESDGSQFSRLQLVATFVWIIYISEKWTSYYLLCLLFIFVELQGSLEDFKYKDAY